MPIFNDSNSPRDLQELCSACHRRNGLHSMFNKCPVITTQGRVVPREYTSDQFEPSGEYETAEA